MPIFSILFGDVNAILSYTDTQKVRNEIYKDLIREGVNKKKPISCGPVRKVLSPPACMANFDF